MSTLWVWYRTKQQRGFSLVEILLASTVFAILVTGITGAFIYGRISTANAGYRTQALQLAEEGLEATRNIAAASFSNLISSGTPVGDNQQESGADVNNNATSAYKVTAGASGGSLSSISVYITSADVVSPHIQAALYADSGGIPGARLATSSVRIASNNSWNTFPMTGITINANTSYWIALSSEGNNWFAMTTGSGATSAAYDTTSGYPAPSTFVASVTSTDKLSFYMTVSTGGQGLTQLSNQWAFSGTSDVTDSFFTRQISISDSGTNRKRVTCTVSWPQNGSTVQVALDTYLTNWSAATTPVTTPGPIMMVYSKSTTIPYYRTWNGTTWSAEAAAQTVVGNINHIVLKSARTRNEAILGVQTDTGAIYIQVWNGTSWGNLTQVGTSSTVTSRGFDIAYEKNSDQALITYSPNSTSIDFAYRKWNGSTLSTETVITAPPTTGKPYWIEMRQNPLSSSNEIAMIMSDATSAIYGMVWTGSSWNSMGVSTTWDTLSASAAKKDIDVEYEQQSGRAMFMWGDAVATDQYYRIWNGSTLTSPTLLDIAAEGGVAEWIQLASRPNSNEIMLGVQDAGADLNTRKWSGSAWDTATQHAEHSAAVENILSRNFDIVWETHTANPGKAWLVWGNGATVTAKQWSGTAWGTGTTLSGSDDTSFIKLRADPVSGAIFAGVYQNATAATSARDINERHLIDGGAAWTAKNTLWGGPTGTDPVYFRVDIATP